MFLLVVGQYLFRNITSTAGAAMTTGGECSLSLSLALCARDALQTGGKWRGLMVCVGTVLQYQSIGVGGSCGSDPGEVKRTSNGSSSLLLLQPPLTSSSPSSSSSTAHLLLPYTIPSRLMLSVVLGIIRIQKRPCFRISSSSQHLFRKRKRKRFETGRGGASLTD